jgi:thymidylate synthase ThyX
MPTPATSALDARPERELTNYPPRRVYSVVGVPPEIQAYALAKYSRSSQGMLESIRELSAQRAEEFLETFYFQYGHRSIADLAHLVFGLEQISILAAMAVVDEQVWDGQERSTRYQPFRKTGWHVPAELAGAAQQATFCKAADALFAAYGELSAGLLEHLVETVPRPTDMSDAAYRRALRARAFDVARSLLPLATHTSVGQIVSARVLERQIGRLLGSEYAELRAIGAELKAACQAPAEAPLMDQSPAPAAPTLVKYALPAAYAAEYERALTEATAMLMREADSPDRAALVELAEPFPDPVHEVVASVLYRFDAAGHSFRQVQRVVGDLPCKQVEEVFDLSLAGRGRHDDLRREHRVGRGLSFDVLVDLGSFRDLHRHRRCEQIQQPLTWSHGFGRVQETFADGLGPGAATQAMQSGLGKTYVDALLGAERAATNLGDRLAANYLLPLAFRTRCLFKMDWAEAAYIIEQRTQPQGHFSYRRVAWGMYESLRARYPKLAEPIRALDPHAPFDLLQR